jgi:hypothetical protein
MEETEQIDHQRRGLMREELLREIAALDDAFEAGTLNEEAYSSQRRQLKRRLMDLLEEQDG